MPFNIVGIGDNCLGSLRSLGHRAHDLFSHILSFILVLGLVFLGGLDALDTEELCLENCAGQVSVQIRR